MVWLLGLERLTVKAKAVVPGGVLLVVPSGWTTSLMEGAGGGSSFTIVPWPCPFAMVAFVAPDRFTEKVSFGSKLVAPLTLTVMVLLVSAGLNVSVPLAAT